MSLNINALLLAPCYLILFCLTLTHNNMHLNIIAILMPTKTTSGCLFLEPFFGGDDITEIKFNKDFIKDKMIDLDNFKELKEICFDNYIDAANHANKVAFEDYYEIHPELYPPYIHGIDENGIEFCRPQ